MKAAIDERGVLVINAETAQEAHTLRRWAERNYVAAIDADAFFRGTGMLVDCRMMPEIAQEDYT
jgi:hypothetical protein